MLILTEQGTIFSTINLPNLSHIQRRVQNIGLRVSKYIRSAKFGGQNNAGVSIGKDTVTKTLIRKFRTQRSNSLLGHNQVASRSKKAYPTT